MGSMVKPPSLYPSNSREGYVYCAAEAFGVRLGLKFKIISELKIPG